jgi:hypothetical protein
MRGIALISLVYSIQLAYGYVNKPQHAVTSGMRFYASFFRIRERFGNIFKDKGMETINFPPDDEMSISDYKDTPSVLTDDICLLPGEPIVRIEVAPQNARRIFTGIDIFADVESVWKVLTAYESLHLVVPSLIKNEVLERYPDGGARMYQVGGANVLPGITFKASVVLDIRIYQENNPLPSSMFQNYSLANDNSTTELHAVSRHLPLQRGVFPRPYALTSLPFRDITMQNVLGEGDFDHYQGIWRLQSLPNCAPSGSDATRLTYAVEIRPKGFLPVALIEKRVASDLQSNLEAIRTFVESRYRPSPDATSGIFERNMETESIGDDGKISVLVTEVRDLRRRVEILERELQTRQALLEKIGNMLSSK